MSFPFDINGMSKRGTRKKRKITRGERGPTRRVTVCTTYGGWSVISLIFTHKNRPIPSPDPIVLSSLEEYITAVWHYRCHTIASCVDSPLPSILVFEKMRSTFARNLAKSSKEKIRRRHVLEMTPRAKIAATSPSPQPHLWPH